jgi:hypothetical protein
MIVKSLLKDKVGKQKVYDCIRNNDAARTAYLAEGDQTLANRNTINPGN